MTLLGKIKSALFRKDNLSRDLAILLVAAGSFSILFASDYYALTIRKKTALERKMAEKQSFAQATVSFEPIEVEEMIQEEIKTVQSTIDTSQWEIYINQWYGISLKYPAKWEKPIVRKPKPEDLWESRYQFRKPTLSLQDETESEERFIGFDLTVYPNSKLEKLFQADEFPSRKDKVFPLPEEEFCQNITGHIFENEDYPAEEIYIGLDDECYYPSLFFSLNQGNYTYNLTPKFKKGSYWEADPQEDLTNYFPEFFSVASFLEITEIVRPKPAPTTPKPRLSPLSLFLIRRTLWEGWFAPKKTTNPARVKKPKKNIWIWNAALIRTNIPILIVIMTPKNTANI